MEIENDEKMFRESRDAIFKDRFCRLMKTARCVRWGNVKGFILFKTGMKV